MTFGPGAPSSADDSFATRGSRSSILNQARFCRFQPAGYANSAFQIVPLERPRLRSRPDKTTHVDDRDGAVLVIRVWGVLTPIPQMQRQSLKARILDHAETRLLEQGFRGMRVDELARDVGISKRTLYEQFRTKEEMAREALIRLAEKLQQAIEAILAEQNHEAVQLRAVVFRICETYSRARPPFYRDLETTPSLTELVEASRTRSFTHVEDLVRSGMANGNFRAELDPRLVRRTLIAAVDTVIRPEVLVQDRVSLEQAFDAIVDLILHGMLQPDC